MTTKKKLYIRLTMKMKFKLHIPNPISIWLLFIVATLALWINSIRCVYISFGHSVEMTAESIRFCYFHVCNCFSFSDGWIHSYIAFDQLICILMFQSQFYSFPQFCYNFFFVFSLFSLYIKYSMETFVSLSLLHSLDLVVRLFRSRYQEKFPNFEQRIIYGIVWQRRKTIFTISHTSNIFVRFFSFSSFVPFSYNISTRLDIIVLRIFSWQKVFFVQFFAILTQTQKKKIVEKIPQLKDV